MVILSNPMDARPTMSDSANMLETGSPSVGRINRYDTLADRAYEQLRHALMNGSFHPGQKLTIRKLAAVLGISATPARDAISRLVSERVLESGPNRTVSVPALDSQKLREIYVLRTALEGVATELGAKAMDRAQVESLEQVQLALIAAMDRNDYKRVLSENEAFHFTIYRASGMPMLVEAIQQLWQKLGPSLNLLYPSYNHSRKGVSHHLAVISALRAGDALAARKALEEDLRDGGMELEKALVATGSDELHAGVR
jgi:DNA-binding GntR family transcriptional regulator